MRLLRIQMHHVQCVSGFLSLSHKTLRHYYVHCQCSSQPQIKTTFGNRRSDWFGFYIAAKAIHTPTLNVLIIMHSRRSTAAPFRPIVLPPLRVFVFVFILVAAYAVKIPASLLACFSCVGTSIVEMGLMTSEALMNVRTTEASRRAGSDSHTVWEGAWAQSCPSR